VEDALTGSLYRRELLAQALAEMGWREDGRGNDIRNQPVV
jgi:hypothetical protein